MSSSDESDDSNGNFNFLHWNNWNAKRKAVRKNPLAEGETKYIEKNKPIFRRSSIRNSLLSSQQNNQKFGNWIPPNILISKNVRQASMCIKKNNPRKMNITVDNSVDGPRDESSNLPCNSNLKTSVSVPHNKIHTNTLDWKNRKDLSNFINMGDEDFVWTVIDRGVFSQFKLWYNEYGHICGSAQGKVLKAGSNSAAFLIIDKPDILRKLLDVPHSEWSSLCESVKQAEVVLKYDAYNNFDLSKMNSLEKLWALLCKRRHLLPGVCVSFYLNGAIKLMKEFQVVPKVIVKEVFDMQGNEIP